MSGGCPVAHPHVMASPHQFSTHSVPESHAPGEDRDTNANIEPGTTRFGPPALWQKLPIVPRIPLCQIKILLPVSTTEPPAWEAPSRAKEPKSPSAAADTAEWPGGWQLCESFWFSGSSRCERKTVVISCRPVIFRVNRTTEGFKALKPVGRVPVIPAVYGLGTHGFG